MKLSKRRIGCVAVLLGLVSGAAVAADTRPGAELQALLERIVAEDSAVPGAGLSVIAPRDHLEWSGAAGRVAFGGPPLAASHSFRVASVTKVFVATGVLRLVEQRRIALVAPVSRYLDPANVQRLRGGGYDPDAILVRHLLEHTSGLSDHSTTTEYTKRVLAEPRHRWTRAEQVEILVATGRPLSAPGEEYHYSDTGYVLLGEIVERVTGKSLPQAVRELDRFERLGIRHSYFETLEPVPPGEPDRAHQYLETLDTTEFDPSFDLYGGGGIVSTTSDLARFYRALLRGEVFDHPQTMAIALATPAVRHADGEIPHAPLLALVPLGSHSCWGHGGFFGALVVYCPDIDVAVAATVNVHPANKYATLRRLVREAVEVLDRFSPP
jgi:D-alanyl-D-alanine carboxypeptidase